MNKYAFIFILGLCLTLTGQVAQGQSANYDASPYPWLGSQFTRATLAEPERHAFEVRAQQKLRDLGDYLSIAGSATYDGQMRKKAVGIALDLFTDDDRPFAMILPDCRKPIPGPIGEYLHLLSTSKQFESMVVTVEEVRLLQPAEETAKGEYAGSLSFKIIAEFKNGANSKCQQSFEGEIGFQLLRIRKRFGDREKVVWETKLAGVR